MNTAKILAIDDNPDNIIVLKALISEAFPDCCFVSALSGKTGIELCNSEHPDVVLLDIVMPEMDGFEVCRQLKANKSTSIIPVVMLTAALTDKESHVRALEMGADAFLAKPVDESELTAQIRAMLRLKEAEDRKLDENIRLMKLVEEKTFALRKELKERKNAEEALRASEGKFRSIFENLVSGCCFNEVIYSDGKPVDYRILDVNSSFERIMGLSRAGISGKLASEVYQTNDLPFFNTFSRVADTGIPEMMEIYYEPIQKYLQITTSSPGKGKFSNIIFDISDRKKDEEKLKESEEKYRRMVDLLPDAVILHSGGKIVFANTATYRLMGATSIEQILGKSALDFVHPNDRMQTFERIKKIYETGEPSGFVEEKFVTFDNEVLDAEVIGIPVNYMGKPAVQTILRNITERKKTEHILKSRENQLIEIFNNLQDAFFQADLSGRLIFVSPSTPRMYGYDSAEELIGQPANILYADQNVRQSVLAKIESAGRLDDFVSQGRKKDGTTFWVSMNVQGRYGDDAQFVGTVGVVRDISERRKAELALLESQERYSSFISQVSEGVFRFECNKPVDITLSIEEQIDWIYDHFFIAECNEAILKMYKLNDEKEMIGKSHLDFHGGRHHPVNRETLRAFIRNGYRIEGAITEEISIDGNPMYISNNSLGIVENNQLIRLWGTQTDITEKIRNDQVQQVLYSITNAALSTINFQQFIEFIRTQIGVLWGSSFYLAFYDEESGMLTAEGRDNQDEMKYWPAEKSASGYVIRHQRAVLLTESDIEGMVESGEIEIVGTPPKVWMGAPLVVNNKTIGVIAVQSYDDPEAYTGKDKQMFEFISHQISITIERKKAEQELNEALLKSQESDRLKSAFLANMSHEIRTPLNSIIGFSELMLDPDFDKTQNTEFAGMINSSGNSLLSIISDIMDLSKIEAGQLNLHKTTFGVSHLIKDLQKQYSYTAKAKGLDFRINVDESVEMLRLESDENRLRQVLVNFVSNAIKFTGEGFVELGAKILKNEVVFYVKDSGIGIPEEFHDKIFERFSQVETSLSRRFGGNGLGLAISKSLIELLGGEVGIESEAGKGSTFYFKIPLTSG